MGPLERKYIKVVELVERQKLSTEAKRAAVKGGLDDIYYGVNVIADLFDQSCFQPISQLVKADALDSKSKTKLKRALKQIATAGMTLLASLEDLDTARHAPVEE